MTLYALGHFNPNVRAPGQTSDSIPAVQELRMAQGSEERLMRGQRPLKASSLFSVPEGDPEALSSGPIVQCATQETSAANG